MSIKKKNYQSLNESILYHYHYICYRRGDRDKPKTKHKKDKQTNKTIGLLFIAIVKSSDSSIDDVVVDVVVVPKSSSIFCNCYCLDSIFGLFD